MKININKLIRIPLKKAKNISQILTQFPNNHIFPLIMLKGQPEWENYSYKLKKNLAVVNDEKNLIGLLVFAAGSFKYLSASLSRIFNLVFPKNMEKEEDNFITMEGPSLESQFKYFAIGIIEK